VVAWLHWGHVDSIVRIHSQKGSNQCRGIASRLELISKRDLLDTSLGKSRRIGAQVAAAYRILQRSNRVHIKAYRVRDIEDLPVKFNILILSQSP